MRHVMERSVRFHFSCFEIMLTMQMIGILTPWPNHVYIVDTNAHKILSICSYLEIAHQIKCNTFTYIWNVLNLSMSLSLSHNFFLLTFFLVQLLCFASLQTSQIYRAIKRACKKKKRKKQLSSTVWCFVCTDYTWQAKRSWCAARKLFKWNSYVSSCQFLALLIFLAGSFWRLPNLLQFSFQCSLVHSFKKHHTTLGICCRLQFHILSWWLSRVCVCVFNILRIFQVFMPCARRWCIVYKCIFNVSSFMSIFVSCSLQNEKKNDDDEKKTRTEKFSSSWI